jgi:hypothetical protein
MTEQELEEIADFVIKYSPYLESERTIIKEAVRKHLEYNTIIVVKGNKKEVTAVCRWNILDYGLTAHVMDLIIEPKYRKKGFIKKLLIKGLIKYPTVKYLSYDREWKYPGRERKLYPVEKILRR